MAPKTIRFERFIHYIHPALPEVTNPTPARSKISLVMSSGGLKPVAAVPLFEFLDEQSIPVDLMVGYSAGSIVSALRGIGYGTREMIDFFRGVERFKPFTHIDYRALLGLAKLPFGRFTMQSESRLKG